jgi:SAM-dependent methyltransferase
MNLQSSAVVEELFDSQWQLYNKILDNNYMGHQEIHGALRNFLLSYSKPFSVLDLGCGNASFISQILLGTNISAYHGIDLSEAALLIAQRNLATIPCTKAFTVGDIVELIPQLVNEHSKSFDIILSTFAIHHLNLEQKGFVISQLSRLLKENGVFVLLDIIRRDDEAREAFIQRMVERVQQEWSLLTPEEITITCDHISSGDFPETQETLYLLGQKNGFKNVSCLYKDARHTSQVLCFYL